MSNSPGTYPGVAIVTGAGSGIGEEIAYALACQGTAVLLNDIDAARASQARDRILAAEGRCEVLVGDAGEVAFVKEMVSTAVRRFGRLDAVVANAGLTGWGDFFEFGEEDMQRLLALNLTGSFFLAQAAAWQMRAQGEGGHILLMSSVVGLRAYPNLAAYGMTKAALSGLAKQLVLPLAPHQIRVNALAPGATLTPRTATEEPGYAQTWESINPDGRVGEPTDIAAAALFLLSAQARHLNGHTLVVDGGWMNQGRYPETS